MLAKKKIKYSVSAEWADAESFEEPLIDDL